MLEFLRREFPVLYVCILELCRQELFLYECLPLRHHAVLGARRDEDRKSAHHDDFLSAGEETIICNEPELSTQNQYELRWRPLASCDLGG